MSTFDAQRGTGRAENPAGRPPALDDLARGRLVLALAAGLTQREAGIWVGCKQSTISYLLNHDAQFEQEVQQYTELAQLDPHLCHYRLSGKSWQAAAALVEQLERRHGTLTTDRLLATLHLAVDKARDVAVRL